MAKSSKQKSTELKLKKAARSRKLAQRVLDYRKRFKAAIGMPPDAVPCNPELLKPDGSYSTPEFVKRGFYLAKSFQCVDCQKSEIWTATQQKWWYEIARGGVWTKASRCRPCRRKMRETAALQREKSAAGRDRKNKLKIAGK
jgi:Probable zinc-ribbon domain